MADKVICDDMYHYCFCQLNKGHDGAHECACDGSWTRDDAGRTEVVRLPNISKRVPPRQR
jgi:hypothetical protein